MFLWLGLKGRYEIAQVAAKRRPNGIRLRNHVPFGYVLSEVLKKHDFLDMLIFSYL